MNHTGAGRENVARKQMGRGERMPTSFNPKELLRKTYEESDYNHYQKKEVPYHNWISHSDYDYRNYASDGPGPVEIEARDKFTHQQTHDFTPDLHGRHFSYRAQAEMDDVNDETFIRSYKGIGPKGYIKSDETIKHDVCQMLYEDKYIDASTIDVVVVDRVVKLSGSVVSRQEKFVIEDLVENVPGVLSVDNHIRVNRDL